MGDVVRINGRIRPRYLAGLFGTVTEVDGAAATVRRIINMTALCVVDAQEYERTRAGA